MSAARTRLAELLLRSPLPLGSLRNAPVVGGWIHRLSHRLLPSDERFWARIRKGPAKEIWLEVNPRTGRDYVQGRTEASVQQVLAEHLKPGMVFYDLGATIGLFSLLASRLVGSIGKVFSFEPDPVTALRLRRNIERNGSPNIVVIEAGVGSATGMFTFFFADTSSPDRGVGRFALGGEDGAGQRLQCYALDDFVREFPHPDAIKCDVEGAELEVIRGARNLIATCRPWIVLEVHSEANGDSIRNLCRDIGYKIRTIDENHVLAQP
jgi:FkbM family methyltransferase